MADNPQANSLANGNAYVAHSQSINVDLADTLLFLRNTGSDSLVIDQITIGSETIGRFEIHIITAAATDAGTAIVPVNLNTAYADTADVLCFSQQTGHVSQGTVIYDVLVLAETTYAFKPQGLILADTVAIAIDCVEELAATIATIEFHFEPA